MLQQSTSPTIEAPWNFIRPVRDKTMVLPQDFVSKHGEGLSAAATLTVANGDKWKIGLNKFGVVDDEEVRVKIRLEDKFDKFLEHYSIETNKENLIHFKYKGMSEFDVSIHHENGNEIQYGSSQEICPQRFEEPKQQTPKKRMNENEPCSQGNPKRVVVEKESQCQNLGEDEFLKLLQNPNIYVSNKREANFTNEARTRAVSLFKKIKPKGSCFLTPMLKSSSSCLLIGAEFVRKYLIKSKEVMLKVSASGDKRSFTYLERNGAFCITKGWGNFVKENGLVEGDILILELISTQEDVALLNVFMDHCYEVEKEKESQGMSEFDVSMHHENDNGINHGSQGGCSQHMEESNKQNENKTMNESCSPMNGKRFVVEKECKRQSLGEDEFLKLLQTYPNIYLSNKGEANFKAEARTRAVSFIKKIKPNGPCYLTQMLKSSSFYLFLGTEFTSKYFSGSRKALLQVSGSDVQRSFNFTKKKGGIYFKEGWRNFVKRYELVEGDILILELISTQEDVAFLKLFIDRSNFKCYNFDKEKESQGEDELLKLLQTNSNIHVNKLYEAKFNAEAKSRAVSFIRKINPTRPSLLSIFSKSSAFHLSIGSGFARKYLRGTKEVILEVSGGDCWPISFGKRDDSEGGFLREGWRSFAEENGLVEGDILILELITSQDDAISVLEVFIDHSKSIIEPLK